MNNLNLFRQSWSYLAARSLFYRPQHSKNRLMKLLLVNIFVVKIFKIFGHIMIEKSLIKDIEVCLIYGRNHYREKD